MSFSSCREKAARPVKCRIPRHSQQTVKSRGRGALAETGAALRLGPPYIWRRTAARRRNPRDSPIAACARP
jgi:hypothetical protein